MNSLIKFYIESDNDIVATIGSANRNGFITCYSKIGQHSEGHIDYFAELKEANYSQYKSLLNELILIGYKVEIETEQKTTVWRNPTKSEINFGNGAIHYADINLSEFIKPDGSLKKWAKIDGLRYNRY
jgi:hypothetical protein